MVNLQQVKNKCRQSKAIFLAGKGESKNDSEKRN